MGTRRSIVVVVALSAIWVVGAATISGATDEAVPRIGLEELNAKLGNPDILVVDVRKAQDWEKSRIKIKGAVREDPKQVERWYSNYPKDKTIVFYCA